MARLRLGRLLTAAALVTSCALQESGLPDRALGPSARTVTTIVTPVPVLVVHAPASIAGTYPVGTASFGPPLTPEGVTGDVVLALDAADASGPSPRDACSPLTNSAAVSGRIAMVERGTCIFVLKVKHAQEAGAIAVILANNVAGPPINLAGVDPTITISTASISLADANLIRAALVTDVVNVTLQGPAADEEPPVITVPVDVTANAATPAGAVVEYAVTVSDNLDPTPALICAPPSGTLFSIGETAVSCTATDAAGNTATASFFVTVHGADDQIDALMDVVAELSLPDGPSTSLKRKLGAALSALASGDQDAACGQLKAFINELNAQAGKKVTMDAAAILIAHAERIRSVLGC
jgi:PA domain-containing protein/HYR domain-containing protein/FIMAH domain-containing protein